MKQALHSVRGARLAEPGITCLLLYQLLIYPMTYLEKQLTKWVVVIVLFTESEPVMCGRL